MEIWAAGDTPRGNTILTSPASGPRSDSAIALADAAKPQLKPSIGLFGVISYALGTAVGVSIFSVFGPATAYGGAGVWVAILLSTLPMGSLVVVYCLMSSAVPVSGASYEWPRKFLGPRIAFMVAWLRIASSVGGLVLTAEVMANYLGLTSFWEQKLLSAAAFTLLYFAGIRGITVSTRVQQSLMMVAVSICAGIAIFSFPHILKPNLTLDGQNLPFGWTGILMSLSILVNLFTGIEVGAELSEEVREASSTVPLGLALSMILALILYLVVAISTVGVLGHQSVAHSRAPLLDAARVSLGGWGGRLIAIAAVASTAKSLNGVFLVFTRYLFAMARNNALPIALAKIHPRFGTPHIAIWWGYVICMIALGMPLNLTDLLLGHNIPNLVKYISTSGSAIVMALAHREIQERAKFKLSVRATIAWAIVASTAVLGVLLLGLSADAKPYVMLAIWSVFGAIFYIGRIHMAEKSHEA